MAELDKSELLKVENKKNLQRKQSRIVYLLLYNSSMTKF